MKKYIPEILALLPLISLVLAPTVLSLFLSLLGILYVCFRKVLRKQASLAEKQQKEVIDKSLENFGWDFVSAFILLFS